MPWPHHKGPRQGGGACRGPGLGADAPSALL